MQIFNTKENWLIALTDAEIISVTAKMLHCQNNNINATKEEKLKALNYYRDKLEKERCLENEIKLVRDYESSSKEIVGKKARTKKCDRDS